MSKSAFAKVRDAMAPQTAAMTTEALCTALLVLDGPDLDEPERTVRAVLEGALCERHAEAYEASLRWYEDREAGSHAEAITTAALVAAGESALKEDLNG
jgi:hypothetical protein